MVQCGGEAALNAALSRGAVRVSHHEGTELYFFPKVTSGCEKALVDKTRVKRAKETSNEAYDAVASLMDKMGWSIDTAPEDLQAHVASSADGKPATMPPMLLDKLATVECGFF